MEFIQLTEDRFLRKDPNQSDQTKDAVYTAGNPAPKRGDDSLRKQGRPKGSEEDDGAPNILTGTVIVSCFIQTSALPSRIELQGNDITFFDDTTSKNGVVSGDTSRLIFTHGSAKKGEIITQGFILEKRASIWDTYDNVLSWYALPPVAGAHNYFFLGRNGTDPENRNLNTLTLAINGQTDFIPPVGAEALNGSFIVEYSEDGEVQGQVILTGKSKSILPQAGLDGFSALLVGGEGGVVGLGYITTPGHFSALIYAIDINDLNISANLIPDSPNAFDLGSASSPFRAIYADSIGLGGGGIKWLSGTGSPEAVVTAPVGSLYSNVSGGASTTLYVKTSGTGNTGWTAK